MKQVFNCIVVIILLLIGLVSSNERPRLFMEENWKEIPAEIPVNQKHVQNPDLILHTYGPGKDLIKKSHHDKPADDPYYVWSGLCKANWAITLQHKNYYIDLTGLAKIKWRTKQSGFRRLYIILKLKNGSWLISDQFDDASMDWRVREFNIKDIKWRQLDIETITEGKWIQNPDLSQVDEIGCTDLMRGGKSAACSRLDWIKVWGQPIDRD